jgi:NADH-quinone oxidoreductase subunit C
LLPDDWIGNPLRKDYVEAPDYHGISTMRESLLSVEIPGRS